MRTSKSAAGDVHVSSGPKIGGSVAQPEPFHASSGKNEPSLA